MTLDLGAQLCRENSALVFNSVELPNFDVSDPFDPLILFVLNEWTLFCPLRGSFLLIWYVKLRFSSLEVYVLLPLPTPSNKIFSPLFIVV